MMQVKFLIVLLFVAAACGTRQSTTLKQSPSPDITRTARVEQEHRTIEVAATVRAADVAQLASRFGGFVSAVPVQAGMHVKKGSLLVLLDERNLTAQRQKAAAGNLEAERAAEGAEAQMRLAANTFERIRGLYEKKSASRQEFEEAESKKQAAEAAYQASLQRVAQAKSEQRDLNASADHLRITAPFDGVITSVSVDAGTFVNAGQSIVSLEDPSAYQILFSVEEDLLNDVPKDREVPVSIPAISSERLVAKIDELSTVADNATRTFQVKATLPPHKALRSGLSARVFLSTSGGSSLWIPQEFLTQKSDLETVLVREQNEWRRILVKSGDRKDGKVEILAGLNRGEEVGLAGKEQ